MPKRDVAPFGAPCWIDLMTSDQERSQAFYTELLGWTVDDPGPDYGGYRNFLKDGLAVAGCMHNDGETAMPDVWSVYLATYDARATTDAASIHGGAVLLAPMAVMELGTMAVVADAGQASVGVWQPGEHKGFGVLAEPGTPSWFELHTRDYEKSVGFYHQVFGWDLHVASDTPDFRYTTLGEGDAALAGIMDASATLPDGVPSHWVVYFGVDDTDGALRQIVDLGGTILVEAQDTPYGRLAQAADPTGAPFRLVAG